MHLNHAKEKEGDALNSISTFDFDAKATNLVTVY
jgi:hypothetical protein